MAGSTTTTSKKFKREKFAENIQHKISTYFRRDVADTRLQFLSITKIELNNDFSHATVYWDTFDNNARGDIMKAINGLTGKVRHYLSTVLDVRQVPHISFKYDEQFIAEQNVMNILESDRSKLDSDQE